MAGEAGRCQRARLCSPCGHVQKAELYPEGSGNPLEGSELGMIRLEGGTDQRGTGTEAQRPGAGLHHSDFIGRVEVC